MKDHQATIDTFLSQHSGKPVVVVQGLGFVGAVMSLVCANARSHDYAVIGVDLSNEASRRRIKSINEGTFPISSSDPKIDQFYRSARRKGNLLATYDTYAYSRADVVIVDINLDVEKSVDPVGNLADYCVDLAPFQSAMSTLGSLCKPNALILVETTVPPGTCEKIVEPTIKAGLAARGLPTNQIKIGHSYERVMPGPNYVDSIQNFYRVYSGVDTNSEDATEQFLRTIISTDKYPLTRLSSTTATEMAKVLENSYRATNIAFAVEWTRFAEEAGTNLYEIVDAIRMRPTHANLMYPGIGVGGYCLTKDPLMASWSRTNLFCSPEPLGQSVKSVAINDQMPLYAYQFLERHFQPETLSGKRIALLGVSYRSNVGDTRYSPVEAFYRHLRSNNCTIYASDPYVEFWEEVGLAVHGDCLAALVDGLDVVAVTTAHEEYKSNGKLLSRLMEMAPMFVLDTVGALADLEIKMLSEKHQVRVVGRGDI